MNTTRKPSKLQRLLAALMSALIGLGPVATPSYAALTALSDEPLNVKNSSKPNIVLTVDDSTSMLFDFLPDYVAGSLKFDSTGVPSTTDTYCRDGYGTRNALCGVAGYSVGWAGFYTPGYIYEQYNYPFTKFAAQDATPLSYNVSGPGMGCDPYAGKCSSGVDYGTSPGLPMYPASAVYADQINPNFNAGKPINAYAYWKLWPAPAHSNAFNHLYYNPMLKYDPPANSDGTFKDSMDAAHTTNWTKVPSDPWASTVVYVDLTADVTVGLWCNSDWSVGKDNDPAFCRTNGIGTTATDTRLATTDGDYLYPNVPPNIDPFSNLGYNTDWVNHSPSTAYTIGESIAYSKVAPSTKALNTAAWNTSGTGTAQDSSYFYENDNVIWCDATATNWPQKAGPSLPQTCTGEQTQTCVGFVGGTCTGGSQTCKGTAQTCQTKTNSCNNRTTTQTCQAPQAQTCNGITAQTCQGYKDDSCGPKAGQTCNGYQTQTCGLGSQVCNNYKTQVCNITKTCAKSGSACSTSADCPNDDATCSLQWDPPGCNLCVGAECPKECTQKNICSKQACVTAGKCSQSGATCSTDANCPAINGTCSLTGTSCTPGSCPAAGKCSISTGTTCTSDANCPAINGTCSKTGVTCQKPNEATQCPSAGSCVLATATACTSDTNCPDTAGHCSIATGTSCTTANAGTNCPPLGTCSISGAQCKNTAACPNVGGTCNITGEACGSGGTCNKAGICSLSGDACSSAVACPTVKQCSITGLACAATADCPAQDLKCSISNAACSTNADCPTVAKTCTAGNVGASCSSNANCNVNGHCSVNTATSCTKNADCATVAGACSLTGLACTTDANCPAQPTTLGVDFAVCSDKLADGSKSLRQDADNDGVVCRRNNKDYADGTTAARFNYPNAKYNTPVTAGTGANACTATPRYRSVPRHYWKTNVEWCDKALASGPWKGYGDSTGSCQSYKDESHTNPRFYKFGVGPTDASYLDNVANPAFERVDLVPGNTYTHTYTSVDWLNTTGPKVTGTESVTRSYAEEMENYANWFAYYRTRINAVKTVLSLSFLGKDPTTSKFNVDDKFRVGLHSLSADGTGVATMFVPVDDFATTQKSTWADKLFGMSIRMAQDTPNLDAMTRIGEYYHTGMSDKLPDVSTDPIVLSCQKNWHMLFTDGLTYQASVPTVLSTADQDDVLPSGAGYKYIEDAGLVRGANWPAPYREDTSKKIGNSASDLSTYYWIEDLRPSMTNNVGVSASDKANWQHVNFAAISLGTEGKLAAGNQSGVETQLAAGSIQWPTPYPTVNQPDASGVDDLWHAAVNSRGRFVNADNADEIKLGLGAILADIANTAGSRAGASLQSINFKGAAAYSYRVTFEPGWGGTLTKAQIGTTTYEEIPPAVWQVGGGKDVTSPSDSLYAQLTPTMAKPEPWYTNRNIVTMHTNGTAVPFVFDKLSATQQDALAPGKADRGLQVLEYLRGSNQNEGTGTLNFRKRVSPLGDIVNASPKYVGPPSLPYTDYADPGYSSFKDSYKTRQAMIYAAANDGMLHAVDDSNGFERFAYIPRDVIRPAEVTGTNPDPGLPALTLKEGALPPFKHHFYVDSTPKVVDVDFGGEKWHSVLVGGLGKGGHSYYALDVTTPANVITEDDALKTVLWEFTDSDLGYTYGSPIITKTAAWSNKWVAIIPSGYNNTGTGKGKIFFVDVATGELLKTMTTTAGSTTSPAGLAQIAAFTQDYHNYMSDEVYGGDQYGNLWRFDIRDKDPANWKTELLAVLTDPSGNRQPVTTAPQIEVDIANGADRWVFVGTGRLLDESDLSDDQIQTMYAIRDGTQRTPSTIVSGSPVIRSDLVEVASAAGTGTITAHGWYDDLALHSRVVTPYQAVLSILVYSATKPQTDPCLTGQQADIFIRDFAYGTSLIDAGTVTEDLDCSNPEYCTSSGGAVDAQIVGTTKDGSPTADLGVAITVGGGAKAGKLIKVPMKKPTWAYSNRLSWRILSE